ncbi:hypothetical protein MKZ38_004479 [Zalerion maritima]|uniref:Uncharacterized protein n=1 Tax=Zalerion maritima TaxID=339359 RepID=A0AAD5WPI9_9PEZI|nr:hypothetical protein MKZ38_004479 [Zalerion maritima]
MSAPIQTLLLVGLATVGVTAVPTPKLPSESRGGYLSACSTDNSPKCKCPAGTTLQQSTTQAVILADVADVADIMGSYQDTAWFGESPAYVTGPDNTVGSSRTMIGGTPEGEAEFTEALYEYECDESGFKMAYTLENAPISYTDPDTGESGSYAGYWDILLVHGSDDATYVKWGIYACFTTDEVDGIEAFHEGAITNVEAMLAENGLSDGFSKEPMTIELFLF